MSPIKEQEKEEKITRIVYSISTEHKFPRGQSIESTRKHIDPDTYTHSTYLPSSNNKVHPHNKPNNPDPLLHPISVVAAAGRTLVVAGSHLVAGNLVGDRRSHLADSHLAGNHLVEEERSSLLAVRWSTRRE